MRVPKAVRNSMISSMVLMVLFVVAGVGYTLYQDLHVNKSQIAGPVVTPALYREIKPTKQGANVPEGAAIEALTSPAVIGDTVSVTVKTNPGSTCMIAVVYNNIASKDPGLKPGLADDFGTISWTWKIDSSVPEGSWPVNVTCELNKKTAFVQGYILITKA